MGFCSSVKEVELGVVLSVLLMRGESLEPYCTGFLVLSDKRDGQRGNPILL